MANVRFKTPVEIEVEVVGHYTPETPARGMMGPPEDSEPGEPEEFELEAVLLTLRERTSGPIDILGALSEEQREDLRQAGMDEARDQMDADRLEQQLAREEARRDAKEDR
jgi:hypothetical protein